MKKLLSVILCWLILDSSIAQSAHSIKKLEITILSTMLTEGKGIGEWGFSALVEADSLKLLFDTGSHMNTVLDNSKELNIDLLNIKHLILSHSHWDHTTGWLQLRNALSKVNKDALSITYGAPGIFDTRIVNGTDDHSRKTDSAMYVQSGGQLSIRGNFYELFPGIFLTGNVKRVTSETNFNLQSKKRDANGNIVLDDLPEDMSLIIRTTKGLVLLSGCGHSGIINTILHTEKHLPKQKLYAAIGGFHLFQNIDAENKWTALQLKKSGLRYFMGAHCTGIEPVYQIRQWSELKRGECIVGAVGTTFDISKGFTKGPLTH